ncbi:PIN domain-containing protein [Treponema sp.]|uniref:PIN domain-containing protein n=1 Tax=Treponema sp. TaxID=166 RepID=UPI00388E339D
MILLDTNIVIDMINNQNDPHWDLLHQENIVLCGIVIAELYRGIKNQNEGKAIELFVNSVDSLPLQEDDWKQIGLFIAKLRDSGLIVPLQDATISYLALKFNCSVCTNDKHFKLIREVEEELQLH